jgi:hypothetical protein
VSIGRYEVLGDGRGDDGDGEVHRVGRELRNKKADQLHTDQGRGSEREGRAKLTANVVSSITASSNVLQSLVLVILISSILPFPLSDMLKVIDADLLTPHIPQALARADSASLLRLLEILPRWQPIPLAHAPATVRRQRWKMLITRVGGESREGEGGEGLSRFGSWVLVGAGDGGRFGVDGAGLRAVSVRMAVLLRRGSSGRGLERALGSGWSRGVTIGGGRTSEKVLEGLEREGKEDKSARKD